MSDSRISTNFFVMNHSFESLFNQSVYLVYKIDLNDSFMNLTDLVLKFTDSVISSQQLTSLKGKII